MTRKKAPRAATAVQQAPTIQAGAEELSAEMRELERLLTEKARRMSENQLQYIDWTGYEKHKEAMAFEKPVIAVFGGNRVGKSELGAFIVACHATGRYPSWWKGRKFTGPVDIWCASVHLRDTRDIIQAKLFGKLNEGGMIPKECILGFRRQSGVPDAIDTAYIRHASGGTSTIGMRSSQQGRAAFNGTARHIIWLDEEPEPDGYDVFSECRTRTMTVNGQVLITYTPLNGMSEMYKYLKSEDNKDLVDSVEISWDDAPHLDEKAKRELAGGYMDHELDARRNGRAVHRQGLVFPFSEREIICDDFQVPDAWPHVAGFDIGFASLSAAVMCVRDPKTGVAYFCSEYAKDRTDRDEHARYLRAWGEGLYIAIDPSANRSESDGRKSMRVYRELGLNVHSANNSVDEGIGAMYEAFKQGRLKVMPHLKGLREELRYYQFDKGSIKKVNDHRLDAARYAFMALEHARPLSYWRALARAENRSNRNVYDQYQPASHVGY